MNLSLPPQDLAVYVGRQLDHFFPDGAGARSAVTEAFPHALSRVEHCFRHVGQRYFQRDGQAVFDHLNTDQYAAFLYLLANSIHRADGDLRVAAKLYALNKALHGLDVFYAVELPDIFCFVHPVGTVIGRGAFQDYFCAYQNVTVGGDLDGNLPVLGRGVVMYGGSRVVGRAQLGDNVLVSAGASILGQTVPSDCVVAGASPSLSTRPTRRDVVRDVFEDRP
ncbi:MAG: serine acetyltransferase [Alphaproteobacteria bacterium]|nr:serine acetyltransferase [Alphaproteobacteria bacterium]